MDQEPKLSSPSRNPWTLIDLFHKERGGKGVWKAITQSAQVRVTKNVGKRIKVVIKSSVKFSRSDLKLRLIDLSAGYERDGQFSFESSSLKDNEWGGETADMELKLFTLAKKLIFHSDIRTDNGSLVSRSVWFGTHNSGKQRKKRKLSDGEDSLPKRQKGLNSDGSSDESPIKSDHKDEHRSHSAIILPPLSFQNQMSKQTSPRPYGRSIPAWDNYSPNNVYGRGSPGMMMPHEQDLSPFRGASRSSNYQPQILFFGKYPDYRNHFSFPDLTDALDLISQLPSHKIEWYQGTPPTQNRTLSCVIEETIQLFGCVEQLMTQEGIILSLQQIALVPVLFAGLLQFSLISPNVKILSHIIASHWTFPNALLQREVEFLKGEAQRMLESVSQNTQMSGTTTNNTFQETKTIVLPYNGEYYSLEIQVKWTPTSGIPLQELHRLNYWTNETMLRLGLTNPKTKFIFSMMSCFPQNEHFTLAVYRFDKLLHSKNHYINPRCSCLFLDAPDLKGEYTFVAFFNRPIREFPFSGYISLHDFRYTNLRQILVPCAPSEIKDFPHIWVVANLTVDGNYSTFGSKLNGDQSDSMELRLVNGDADGNLLPPNRQGGDFLEGDGPGVQPIPPGGLHPGLTGGSPKPDGSDSHIGPLGGVNPFGHPGLDPNQQANKPPGVEGMRPMDFHQQVPGGVPPHVPQQHVDKMVVHQQQNNGVDGVPNVPIPMPQHVVDPYANVGVKMEGPNGSGGIVPIPNGVDHHTHTTEVGF